MIATERQCRMDIEAVCLAWRPTRRGERFVVGSLRSVAGQFRFRYDGSELTKAMELGFEGYPGMEATPEAVFNGRAMEAFKARLPQPGRPDRERLLSPWGLAADAEDPMLLLAATGGRLVTDTFEFLPLVHPVPGTRFHTLLAGCRYHDDASLLADWAPGASLELAPEFGNIFDPDAVRVLFLSRPVGYLSKVVATSVRRALDTPGITLHCELLRVSQSGDRLDDATIAVTFEG